MSPFRRIAVGAAAAFAVILTAAVPAAAHDELSSSSPAADERLLTAPDAVTLEFSAEVMELGALVMVVDSAATDWAAGEPAVAGRTVTVPLTPDLPEGGYEVRWRVVSSDGHPISGVIPFTVGDAEPLPQDDAAAAAAPAAGDVTAADPVTTDPPDGGAVRTVLIGAAGAATAVALLVVIRILRRRRSAGVADAPGATPPSEQ